MTQEEFENLRIGDMLTWGTDETWVVTAFHEGQAILTQTVGISSDNSLLPGFRLEDKHQVKENHILENVRYLSAQLSAQIKEWEKGNSAAAMATSEVSGNHLTGCKVFIHEADVEYGHSPAYIGLYTDPRDGNTHCGRCHGVWTTPPWSPGGEK